MRRLAIFLAIWAGAATADPVDDVVAAATASFDRLPQVERVQAIGTRCGAGQGVNTDAVYCTTDNTIYVTGSSAATDAGPYLVAHLYGHAVQVQHGVADVALRTITANRDQEAALRRDVTRMVECIAGVILAQADQPVNLDQVFEDDPFSGSHWGRSPLTRGPQVHLARAERNRWLQAGFDAAHPRACDTVAFPSDLVVDAFLR